MAVIKMITFTNLMALVGLFRNLLLHVPMLLYFRNFTPLMTLFLSMILPVALV